MNNFLSMNVENEVYDIVDCCDHVIGQATRKHIHENKLLHRSIHILVFNSQRKLFLQKRALSKDESPGLWDTSSAGHVDTGESYIDCAHRELFEELGLKAVLSDLIRIPACQETHGEHVQVYTCVTDDEIHLNQDEISEGAFYTISHIRKLISLNPQEFTSSFKMLFDKLDEFENSIFLNKITS
jgi:isopentenyl-diphosphate Delta-isomerase